MRGKFDPDPGIRVQEEDVAKETVARVDLGPIICGTADEVCDAAHALSEKTLPVEGRDRPARDIALAFLAGIDGDMSKVILAGGDPAVRRTAIHRVAGRRLALDEAVRGSDAIEVETDASRVFG